MPIQMKSIEKTRKHTAHKYCCTKNKTTNYCSQCFIFVCLFVFFFQLFFFLSKGFHTNWLMKVVLHGDKFCMERMPYYHIFAGRSCLDNQTYCMQLMYNFQYTFWERLHDHTYCISLIIMKHVSCVHLSL